MSDEHTRSVMGAYGNSLVHTPALDDLAATSARRRTEREAVEEALALLAERDRRDDALAEFVATVHATFGEPTSAEVAEADELYEQYRELRANR